MTVEKCQKSAHGHQNKISYITPFIICQQTHKEEQTLIFTDGSTAAQEAQEEEHAAHAQDDVDAGEQQRVGCYYFPEPRWVHQHPHSHSQEERPPQLMERDIRHQLDKTEIGCVIKLIGTQRTARCPQWLYQTLVIIVEM